MGLWTDIARYVGPTDNTSGVISDHKYVVIHTADGSYDGTISWQKNPSAKVSSHFIVAKDGRIGQMIDTGLRSWAQIEGNPYSISIENEGNENTPLTDAQLRANAAILARAHQVYGIPLQLTGHVGTPGLGHHSMGAESGVNWGHSACPGEIIKSQKPQVLAYAQAMVTGGKVAGMSHTIDEVYDALVAIANGNQPPDGGNSAVPEWVKTMQSYGPKLDKILTQLATMQADIEDLKTQVGNSKATGTVQVTGQLTLGV